MEELHPTRSFLQLMASMHEPADQVALRIEADLLKCDEDIPYRGDASPPEFPVVPADGSLVGRTEMLLDSEGDPIVMDIAEQTEHTDYDSPIAESEPMQQSTPSGTVFEALDAEQTGYSSATSASTKRRKRRWAGTDLLVNNPDFAGAIEQAIRNASARATAAICHPREGQVFDTEGEAYQFYNIHAWDSGFSIRLGRLQKNPTTKNLNMREFQCSRSGTPRANQRSTTRCDCPARLRLLKTST
uniref:FAR1 domain-containing protein n=1 Tax=Oryza meridionalis TaxID=40149 RepID=A0A0E0D0T4_9ORYZ